jgi:hypothetical protein
MLGETSRAGFLRYIGLPAKRALRLHLPMSILKDNNKLLSRDKARRKQPEVAK